MSTKITVVIFDLDDTLYDEIEYCQSGFRAAAQWLNHLKPTCGSVEVIYDVFWRIFQTNKTKTFDAALTELAVPADKKLIQTLIRRYRCHRPALKLPRESRQVLQDLSEDYTLALLTDGYLPAQKLKVGALGIQRYFTQIVYTEQLGRQYWKPSPAGFQAIVNAVGRPPQSMIYVGDNPAKDFIAPNRLGMKTLQVLRPRRLHTREPSECEARAQYRLEALADLPAVLSQWNSQTPNTADSLPCRRD